MKEFHILALDGGGSKGLMQALILQDVMNATTTIKQNPDRVLEIFRSQSVKNKAVFSTDEGRDEFINEMKLIDDHKAIHPTEVFDMIAGTSVGALMAFALVGGKACKGDDLSGERVPMTLQEVVDFMKETTNEIWSGSGRWSAFWNTITSCKLRLHSRKGINNVLQETFGEATLRSFQNNKCIAAAVARRFGCNDQDEEEKFDCLEVFDTHPSCPDQKVTDVLKATSNAPIYFKTPTMINEVPYVDGGLGGNCPIPQGLRRMKELWTSAKFGSGLSIAPPRQVLDAQPNGLCFWLNYFPQRTTDGMASYCEYKKQHLGGANQRIYPRSIEAKQFKVDDKRVDEMIKCMEKERKASSSYLQEIVSAALVIAARVKGIDPVKLWSIAEIFVKRSLEYRNSGEMKINLHSDNDLAIMNAMSKLKLDKTSSIRHEIIRKKALVQRDAKLYNEALETLEQVDWEGDGVDEFTKDEMKGLLKDIEYEQKREGKNFVNADSDSDSDSDSD